MVLVSDTFISEIYMVAVLVLLIVGDFWEYENLPFGSAVMVKW
jgi:hypothetical protein